MPGLQNVSTILFIIAKLAYIHLFVYLLFIYLFASVRTCTCVGGCGLQKRPIDPSELELGQKGCGRGVSI